jgi:hypothetical protein
MKVADLSPEIIGRIKTFRYDRIIGKHEGPWKWAYVLEDYETEFILVEGRDVLLPISGKNLPNITILRAIFSADGSTLTLFLKDTTYTHNPDDEWFDAGRIAICEKMRGTDFYIAVVYHEWFMVENEGLG